MNSPLPFHRVNDFLLLSVIQEGLFSVSAVGYQESLKRPVFLKLLKPTTKNQPEWLERFTREAQICAQFKNIHIVDVYLIGEYQNYTYMAMEYVPGLSLKNILSQEKRLDQNIAFAILRQILDALDYVHQQGIIHRDLKPGNILLDIYGHVRLTDFGLAYLGEDTSITQTGTILGTPAYMCPEQILGNKILPQSDFFSLGATFYEMLTGEKAFAGESYSTCIQKILNENPPAPSTFWNTLQPGIDEFISWLLEKNPSARPTSVSEIIKKIEELSLPSDDKLHQPEIGKLVQKYYRLPSVLPKALGKDISKNLSMRKDKTKILVSRKWPMFSFFIVIGFIIIFLFKMKNDRDLKKPTGIPQISDSTTAEIASNHILDSNALIQKNGNRNSQEFGNRDVVSTDTSHISSGYQEAIKIHSMPDISGVREESNHLFKLPKENEEITEFKKSLLTIETFPWGILYVDGAIIDSIIDKKEISLLPGRHQVVLAHPEYAPKVLDVNLSEAETLAIFYSFLENSGFLYVEARPWADIYLDGKYRETTPLQSVIIVSPGDHLLELRHPSFTSIREIITIQANDTIYVRKNFYK